MAAAELRLRLKPGREKSVRNGHPWLFSGAVAEEEGPPDAPLARVLAADGTPLGVGFHSRRSQIRVRFLGPGVERPDGAFFAARLAAAAAWRRRVLPADTTGYRLLNAEGDGVPGWTVDRFGDVLVSQMTVAGLEAARDEAYAALRAAAPAAAIVQANDLPARRLEGLPLADEAVAGEAPAEAAFREAGLRFTADLASGQKTGFYCDQRENRRLVGGLAAGLRVLDLFAHSGAFGVHAARGGARQVVCVESSAPLVARGRRHFADNGLPAATWHDADVFRFLREPGTVCDLVVCDPPPLARRRVDVERAARAYKDLNRLALGRLAPGGFLLTFSCSAAVDARLFRQILFAAAVEARADLKLLQPLSAAPDHPVAVTHPEGEYLKGWWGVVT